MSIFIRKVNSYKKRGRDLRKALREIETAKKRRRILFLAMGLSTVLIRGGTQQNAYIDMDNMREDCTFEAGLRFLDNGRLRKIVHSLYKHKRQGKLIYVTATAICHLSRQYGQTFLELPFAIGDFGFTSIYQTLRKIVVAVIFSGAAPLFFMSSPLGLILLFLLTTVGFRLAFTNLDLILTSPVLEMNSLKNIQPRIFDVPDVIIVNFRQKIFMQTPKQECWLPYQAMLNPGCIKSTEVPIAINLASQLEYTDVVNMQDVTGLSRVDFSDILDLPRVRLRKGKLVKFLDKFKDSKIIGEAETWDVTEVSKYIAPKKKIF